MKYTYVVRLQLRGGVVTLKNFTSECPINTGHTLIVRMDVIHWLCGLELRVLKVQHLKNLIARHNDPDISSLMVDFAKQEIREHLEKIGDKKVIGSFEAHGWQYKANS